MGIYSYYLGDMDIPEVDRPEYARQALAMLRAGGMMSVERIQRSSMTTARRRGTIIIWTMRAGNPGN